MPPNLKKRKRRNREKKHRLFLKYFICNFVFLGVLTFFYAENRFPFCDIVGSAFFVFPFNDFCPSYGRFNRHSVIIPETKEMK